MNERDVTTAEVELTEEIFNLLGQNAQNQIDFADNGREIFLTNYRNEHFTITVKQDE